jgi:hypothetical protein
MRNPGWWFDRIFLIGSILCVSPFLALFGVIVGGIVGGFVWCVASCVPGVRLIAEPLGVVSGILFVLAAYGHTLARILGKIPPR